MFKIKTLNKISEDGLSILRESNFKLGSDFSDPVAILLRSYNLHKETLPESVIAVGRAGAGVNNIPVAECTQRNIVVFNTPGANANAVKELVLSGMFIAARNLFEGIHYAKSLSGNKEDMNTAIEEQKSKFKGFELQGKRLGVVGLGAIGMMVANSAIQLGLSVTGYDPFISVSRAWELSSSVEPASNITKLLSSSDFISIHMPLTSDTKGFIDAEKLAKFKKGAILLNFARSEIVNEEDVIQALSTGQLSFYVTDFPSPTILSAPNVIPIPHLGASTAEAENNCAIMIAHQIKEYILNGNIQNAVNFPNCHIERTAPYRLVFANQNIPNMVGQVSGVLAKHQLNIQEMMNKSKDELAYNIIELNEDPSQEVLNEIRQIKGISFVRLIK